jgi:hypothetical protein
MNHVLQEAQQDLVAVSLKKTEGFVGTFEQGHYDVCEEAVMGVLSQVRKVARQWKVSHLVSLDTVLYSKVTVGYPEQIRILRRTRIPCKFLSLVYHRRHTCASRHHRS